MAETYFPFDAGAGANVLETQWREMARYWRTTGVLANYLDELEIFADSTGMLVKLKAGEAWVDGFKYKNDAEMVIAITSAHPTYGRIDRVILRLDVANNIISAAVLDGTPSAAPVAPTLTQNQTGIWEISLAQITVAAGSITIAAGNVADKRSYSYATIDPPLETEYDSGWFAVVYNTLYTKAHGLGTIPKTCLIEWCSTNTPTAATKIYVVYNVITSTGYTASVIAYDKTNFYVKGGNSSGSGTISASDGTQSGGGYWRIRAWK